MADTTPNNALDEVAIHHPVDVAIIEIAGIAERFDNYGEFRAELVAMRERIRTIVSEGVRTIAKNKAKEDAKADAKK